MTTFSFSTGNPSNLTGGASASMTDISGSLTDLKTFLNGGSITDTNVTAAGLTDASLTSPTNSVWRPIRNTTSSVFAGQTAGAYWTQDGNTAVADNVAGVGVLPAKLFFPDSASVAVTGKTTRLRVVAEYAVNATAPGITLTFGLYPVNNFGGGAGAVVLDIGTVVTGSTAAVVAPIAAATNRVASSSFDFSTLASVNHVLGVALSGTVATSSVVYFTLSLEQRHT